MFPSIRFVVEAEKVDVALAALATDLEKRLGKEREEIICAILRRVQALMEQPEHQGSEITWDFPRAGSMNIGFIGRKRTVTSGTIILDEKAEWKGLFEPDDKDQSAKETPRP